MKNTGWFGDRQRHILASKGIRTKKNKIIKDGDNKKNWIISCPNCGFLTTYSEGDDSACCDIKINQYIKKCPHCSSELDVGILTEELERELDKAMFERELHEERERSKMADVDGSWDY